MTAKRHIEISDIQIGDKVQVTFAWADTENPTAANFHIGRVINKFYQSGEFADILKFEVENLNRVVYLDRIKLLEKAPGTEPVFVALKESECHSHLQTAKSKGFHGRLVAWNFDRTQYEVESDQNVYTCKLTYSDISDAIFGSCNCLHFINRHKLCKHLALLGEKELFADRQFSHSEAA